jgi:hypothetical protein
MGGATVNSPVADSLRGQVWSLADMIEVHAHKIIGAPVELRTMKIVTEQIEDKAAVIGEKDNTDLLLPHLVRLVSLLADTGARAAIASANRLEERLNQKPLNITYQDVLLALNDIESRFSDEVNFIKVLILSDQESRLFDSANDLLSPFLSIRNVTNFSADWPTAALEFEEAAKCQALGRSNATMFHCMRCLEVAINALSKFLEMDSPTKTAEKNWTFILSKIKSKIDEKYPSSGRLPGTPGAEMEMIYSTLDAVKNPWRNSTMHVDATYLPHESLQILRSTGIFLVENARHFDEAGTPK